MSTELAQADLLAYMKAAIDLETDLVTQETILTKCCTDIQQRKPTLKKEMNQEFDLYPEATVHLTLGYSLIGIAILCVFLCFSVSSMYILWLIGFAICGWLGCMAVVMEYMGRAKNKKTWEKHRRVNAEINKRNQASEEMYNKALASCTASEQSLRDAATPRIEKTRAMLEKLYEKGYIYQKYCNLPALTSIYEYFITGRCSELTGPNGAYNLYESELRADTIINQLNVVITNLEQIRNNQFMLYQQVSAIQRNTNAITSELRQIKGYTIALTELTALNAYYNGLEAHQAEIAALYGL